MTMVSEPMSDSERQLLTVLVTQAWVAIRNDGALQPQARELENMLRKLSGTDTRVVCERAYPSRQTALGTS